MDMRVGAFDRYMSPTYGKNMKLVSSIPKCFLASRKLRELKIFEAPESQISEISDVKNHENFFFFKMFKNDLGP